MKKILRTMGGLLLTLAVAINVVAPIKVEAKSTHWLEVEERTYFPEFSISISGEESQKLVLNSTVKTSYNDKGQKTSVKAKYREYDYDGNLLWTTETDKYQYTKGKLSKVTYANGNYVKYTWNGKLLKTAKAYNKKGKLQSTDTYTYNSNGKLSKIESKEGKTVVSVFDFSNGIKKRMRGYSDGKLVFDDSYDKYGNITKSKNIYYNDKGKKTGETVSTYTNTYSGKKLAKVVAEESFREWKNKSVMTYYTSGVLTGKLKKTVHYEWDTDSEQFKEYDVSTYTYKTDSNNNITEEICRGSDNEVSYKFTHKYKKFVY